MLELELNS